MTSGFCRGLCCPVTGTQLGFVLPCHPMPGPCWASRCSTGALLLAHLAVLVLTLVQVYRQFFDAFPLVPDETHERDLWDGFGPSKKMMQLEVRSSVACRGHGRVEPVLLSPPYPTPGDLGCLSQLRGHDRTLLGAEQQQGWLGSILVLPPVSLSVLRHTSAYTWVYHCNGGWHCLGGGCGGSRGHCSPLASGMWGTPALCICTSLFSNLCGDCGCCGAVHVCLGTHKERNLGEAHIPPAMPILHLAEEPSQWLEEPAGRAGSQGAAGPSGSPTPAGTAPYALPGSGPHQQCCGTCHL